MKDSIIRHPRITLARDLKSATKKEMDGNLPQLDQIIDRFIHAKKNMERPKLASLLPKS